MTVDVYIFGYLSILSAESLATSVVETDGQFVPAKLSGYVRRWNASRHFADNESKRYVHISDWQVARRVAFATLATSEKHAVNGVCRRIPVGRLAELDYREQGYERIDVTSNVSPYDGFELNHSLRCYAYIDNSPNSCPAPVSRSYYDMGRLGANDLNKIIPGFMADYLLSTEEPAVLLEDLAFVFYSADGRHLWLLDERDSSLVLLHRHAKPQIEPVSYSTPELARHVSEGLAWLDLRHRHAPTTPDPRIPRSMARELTSPPAEQDLSKSSYWLCRLIAADASSISPLERRALQEDKDLWVRRAARIRMTAD